MDPAYIDSQTPTESPQAYKRRIYNTFFYYYSHGMHDAPEMRIKRLWPTNDWITTWANLHDTPITEAQKTVWYRTIHGILKTNVRLHKINMSPTDKC
jgi:hypothetical protein